MMDAGLTNNDHTVEAIYILSDLKARIVNQDLNAIGYRKLPALDLDLKDVFGGQIKPNHEGWYLVTYNKQQLIQCVRAFKMDHKMFDVPGNGLQEHHPVK